MVANNTYTRQKSEKKLGASAVVGLVIAIVFTLVMVGYGVAAIFSPSIRSWICQVWYIYLMDFFIVGSGVAFFIGSSKDKEDGAEKKAL